MKNPTLTPEESLLLISKTIEETKERFQNNGHIFVIWGALTLIVFGSQHILGMLGFYNYMMVPVYLFPLGAIYTALYVRREYKKNHAPRTLIGNILGSMGWVVGMNLMIMGFLFSDKLGDALAPVFIILLASMIIVAGLAIRFKPLTIGGLLMNVIAIASFYVERDYHGFSIMLSATLGMLIPGIMLNMNRKTKHV